MDGVNILLDGVSKAVGDYLTTPPDILDQLCNTKLDLMAFTHNHCDHFLPEFVRQYAKLHEPPKLVGPKDVADDLPEYGVITASSKAESIQIIAVPSRHIGTAYKNTPHYSFILRGSSMIWFLGDASPLQWRDQEKLPQPDLLIAPFSYATTEAAWQIMEHFAPKRIILTHLPSREHDGKELWPTMEAVLAHHPECVVFVPDMGEKCIIH